LDTRAAADAATRRGVVRLIALDLGDAWRRALGRSTAWTTIGLQMRGVASIDDLQEDLGAAVADRAFIGDDALPRDRDAYSVQVKRARARLPAVADAAVAILTQIAAAHAELSQQLARLPAAQRPLGDELRAQRDALVHRGFVATTPWESLGHIPRYLQAMLRRVKRYPEHADRDARHAAQVNAWWARYRERTAALSRAGTASPALERFRWMLEELRVSLFAQELRTPVPVSFKRVEKAWAEFSRDG
ncbi:MAG: DUF3418 domain-containing protein, partial [Betaproteobacteria bacterium]